MVQGCLLLLPPQGARASDLRPSENQDKLRHIVEAMINKIMLRFGSSCTVHDVFNLIFNCFFSFYSFAFFYVCVFNLDVHLYF